MQPTSILGDVRGIARDFALEQLPKGYVWDLVNYVPRRRGGRLDCRRAWRFLTSDGALGGPVSGGIHATFKAGTSLLAQAGSSLYTVNETSGAAANVGALAAMVQNGVMLRDRVYFAEASGTAKPKYTTRTGSTVAAPAALSGANAPNGSLLGVYKDRLLVAGDAANPARLYFSPLEVTNQVATPPTTSAWDTKSVWDSSLAITAIWPMGAQVLLFHNGSIEKLRGAIPPTSSVNTDMYLDPFTEQVGCSDPASVVGWQENVIWAAPRGVYLSDGATMRSLTTQGGIGELWRTLYKAKRPGTQVVCGVFLDLLFVSVLTDWDGTVPYDLRPFTLVCDLSERSWWRFANTAMTAAIHSSVGQEELWWGVDGVNFASSYQNRLSRVSDMLFTESETATLENLRPELAVVTPVDQIDGNAVAVLPQVETGFVKLGQEGVKRFRHIHVSHTTETAVPTGDATNKLRVSYRLRPYPFASYTVLGDIPGIDGYRRYRLRLGKRGYGITVKVEQIVPTWLSRLHDIAVDAWAQDRGKL